MSVYANTNHIDNSSVKRDGWWAKIHKSRTNSYHSTNERDRFTRSTGEIINWQGSLKDGILLSQCPDNSFNMNPY